MIFPLDMGTSSSGRSKTLLGSGASGWMEQRDLTFSVAVSIATACSVVVPTQSVAASAETSALLAAGTLICATRVWSNEENTSTRFMARLATKTCLFATS